MWCVRARMCVRLCVRGGGGGGCSVTTDVFGFVCVWGGGGVEVRAFLFVCVRACVFVCACVRAQAVLAIKDGYYNGSVFLSWLLSPLLVTLRGTPFLVCQSVADWTSKWTI